MALQTLDRFGLQRKQPVHDLGDLAAGILVSQC
jgi:hypothetical protein